MPIATPTAFGHVIRLIESELLEAATCGCTRTVRSLCDGRTHVANFGDGPAWKNDCQGCIGERVVAKALGLPWRGTVDTFQTVPDVGGWHVRTADIAHGRLIIRPDDGNVTDQRFVLVTRLTGPPYWVGLDYCMVGWTYGDLVTERRWWSTLDPKRPPAWCMPQSALFPFVAVRHNPIRLAVRGVDLRPCDRAR